MFKKTKQNLVAIHPIFFVLGNILKLDKQWQKKYIFLILLFLSEKQNCIRFFCAIKDQESGKTQSLHCHTVFDMTKMNTILLFSKTQSDKRKSTKQRGLSRKD